jgi:hypothetical protein
LDAVNDGLEFFVGGFASEESTNLLALLGKRGVCMGCV